MESSEESTSCGLCYNRTVQPFGGDDFSAHCASALAFTLNIADAHFIAVTFTNANTITNCGTRRLKDSGHKRNQILRRFTSAGSVKRIICFDDA
jgi:hypothetical protein